MPRPSAMFDPRASVGRRGSTRLGEDARSRNFHPDMRKEISDQSFGPFECYDMPTFATAAHSPGTSSTTVPERRPSVATTRKSLLSMQASALDAEAYLCP